MAQDFSCTDLEFLRTNMSNMWADANFRKEVQPHVDVVVALKEMQTARLDLFNSTDKKAKVKAYWVEACEGAVQDCTRKQFEERIQKFYLEIVEGLADSGM